MLPAHVLALRCGVHLVREGDHYIEVLKKCGEPTLQERWLEEQLVSRRIHPVLPKHYRHVNTEGVVVQLWTYNFGRQKFMQQLRFENGFLERIEKLDYGF